jgi:enamine deaminase RidA (YjgF/YER057c/UK114 family)
MTAIEKKLAELGLKLDGARPAVGNYIGCKIVGELLFASGRVSDLRGEIGKDVTEAAARLAARDTVLLVLAIVKQEIGSLDELTGIVKLQGFLRCMPGFDTLPAVLDGASELLIHLFGEAGKHARTASGVSQLPFGSSLQIDIIFSIKN